MRTMIVKRTLKLKMKKVRNEEHDQIELGPNADPNDNDHHNDDTMAISEEPRAMSVDHCTADSTENNEADNLESWMDQQYGPWDEQWTGLHPCFTCNYEHLWENEEIYFTKSEIKNDSTTNKEIMTTSQVPLRP